MNKPNRNNDARFSTVEQAMSRYNLCRANVEKLAKQAGGFLRFGRAIRIDTVKVDDYFTREFAER